MTALERKKALLVRGLKKFRAKSKQEMLDELTKPEALVVVKDNEVFASILRDAREHSKQYAKKEAKREYDTALRLSLQYFENSKHTLFSVTINDALEKLKSRFIEDEIASNIRAELQFEFDQHTKPENFAVVCGRTRDLVRTFLERYPAGRDFADSFAGQPAVGKKRKYSHDVEEERLAVRASLEAQFNEKIKPLNVAAMCGWSESDTRLFINNNPTAKAILTANLNARLAKRVEEERRKMKAEFDEKMKAELDEKVKQLKLAILATAAN